MKRKIDKQVWNLFFVCALLVIALISILPMRHYFTSPDFTGYFTAFLDAKKATVMRITAASTASSVAITLIPGDAATPIAEKLADISGYSVIILCAVFLEKYLVTITGHIAFGFLIPIACILLIIDLLAAHKDALRMFALKLAAFAIVLFTVIPSSVWLSQTIENTYQESIEETIQAAEESSNEIEQNTGEDENLWEQFISTVGGGIASITANFERILNNFIEAVAIMIVTSCIIPIVVLVCMVWIVKMMFGNTLVMNLKQINTKIGDLGRRGEAA